MGCKPKVRIHRLLLVGLCSCLLSAFSDAMSDPFAEETAAPSARIVLHDDSVIFGDVVDIAEGTVLVSTFWMGEVTVPLASIAVLESEQEIEILTTDDRRFSLSHLQLVDGEVLIEGEDSIPVEQVSLSDPEAWEAGQGYHMTGRASTAFDYNRGNTDTDEINADLEMFLESRRDRFTLRGDLEDTSSNITTTNEMVRRPAPTRPPPITGSSRVNTTTSSPTPEIIWVSIWA